MTDKVILASIASFQNDSTAVAQYNSNNALITTAINNTLSRDGTSPNQMGASLDMNSNQILNLPAPIINSSSALYNVTLTNVNFNSVGDNLFTINCPSAKFSINQVNIYNASASLTTSQWALYTAASAGGFAIVGPTATTVSAIGSTAPATNTLQVLGVVSTSFLTTASNNTLYFRITTPQGSAATASVTLTIKPLM